MRATNLAGALLAVAAVAALLAVPAFADTYYLKLVTRILVLALFAVSLDLLIGYTGLISLGHAAFFGVSAYTLVLASPEYDAGNLLLLLPLCLLVSAVTAAVIGALCVRTRGIYFIMVTLAFAQMLFHLFHDTSFAGGSDGAFMFVKPVLSVGGLMLLNLDDRVQLYYLALGCLAATLVFLAVVLRAPFGQVIQGIRVNEHRIRALGYNPYPYKLAAFTLGGTLAGLAGFLFAAIDGFVAPELLSWHESGMVMVMVILGGMGTLWGPVLGAFAYVGLEEVFRDAGLFGALAERYLLLMGLFVCLVALGAPRGIAGWLRRLGGLGGRREGAAP